MTIEWTNDYSPYTAQDGNEIPAYEVFDENGEKILDTNENLPAARQEEIAQLASITPVLVTAAQHVIDCWEKGDLAAAVRELAAVLNQAGSYRQPSLFETGA
jgi:hypothetical protein